jgi:hexosaminidase
VAPCFSRGFRGKCLKRPQQDEFQAWLRLCALAELLWSPRESRDVDRFKLAMGPHLARLKILSFDFRPLEGPFPKLASTTP